MSEVTTISRALNTDIGPKYLNISNSDLRGAFYQSALFAGADTDTITGTYNAKGENSDEKRVLLSVDLPRLSLNLPELGGKLTPRLWLLNDNTGRSAMTVGIGFFRFICMNGLYIGVNLFGTKLQHRQGPRATSVLDGLPEALVGAMESIASGAATDVLLDAADQKVADPIDVIGSLDLGLKVKDAAISQIVLNCTRSEDNPNTVWGLYNIVNEAGRKQGRSLYKAAVNDMSLLQEIQFLSENQTNVAV